MSLQKYARRNVWCLPCREERGHEVVAVLLHEDRSGLIGVFTDHDTAVRALRVHEEEGRSARLFEVADYNGAMALIIQPDDYESELDAKWADDAYRHITGSGPALPTKDNR